MDSNGKYLEWELSADGSYIGRDSTGAAQARLIDCRRGWLLELRIMSGHWLQDPSLSDKPKILQDRADRIIRNGMIRWKRVMEGENKYARDGSRTSRRASAVRRTA